MSKKFVHPYIPNGAPELMEQMLKELNISSSEDIFKEIPKHLRFQGRMNIPEPKLSEYELKRHVEGILKKNQTTSDNLSFLGGGTWDHYVPAVCDTIGQRDEFLSAYVGDAYSDHGKYQALFESSSMIGDLLKMEAVSTPTYDWANAIGIAARMASRINGRKEVLVAGSMSPSRFSVINNYLKPEISLIKIAFDKTTGLMDLDDLKRKLSDKTSSVYFENPTYFGPVEHQGEKIAEMAHAVGAEVIAGVDPSSLGVMKAPSDYGVDICVGDLQPLGIHMQYGGGLSGYIASRDEEKYVAEYPTLLFGVTSTLQEGEYGFGHVFYERTSYASREKGKDFIGTTTSLFGIIAGVYLALMGPEGMRELGEGIMQRVAYAVEQIDAIPNVKVLYKDNFFKEFVIDFNETGKTVETIHKALKTMGIFGGIDLSCSRQFPEMGEAAIYAITEKMTKEDIDRLVTALRKVC
ncbi:aminomethyl-transferring glycine dehydrogenase subunit GcvPA [Vagococcus elongatus]|uniref:Glycine dehydrogenase (Aminomethyl-transferring) n=1 Tax=Vagococcus elongatus TaxID=180344 RepID=A0A430B4E7_9ENTE|nr:aminomethyl-transferring glycine dehydrogenase subunit GcvPA [Vagococcus elongatus]RSU15230.1 glycine dehydrogenase (aminomethyl-transferring) [Vagococcus elongatus]